jgi:hypothetical protein
MSRRLPSSPAHNPRFSWTFFRSLARGYVFAAQMCLLLRLKIPERMLRLLPIVERATRGVLFAMLTDPAALTNFNPRQKAKQTTTLAPVQISRADFRARLARLKAMLENPSAEIENLKAWIAANRVRIKNLRAARPVSSTHAPSTDDLGHACARARITPQARPPPGLKSSTKTQNNRTSPRLPGRSCWTSI